MEASTNQAAEQQMPLYDLPSKLLCRVINVDLKVGSFSHFIDKVWFLSLELFVNANFYLLILQAEADTDEVYAQITLLPESNVNCVSDLFVLRAVK